MKVTKQFHKPICQRVVTEDLFQRYNRQNAGSSISDATDVPSGAEIARSGAKTCAAEK